MPWIEQLQSVDWGKGIGVALGGYVLGCFTTGYYLVRWRTGQDLRGSGSGSVGAKNAGRLLGPMAFVLTLIGDFAKGALAVWAARYFTADEGLVAVAMLAVVAGHVWPVQLSLRGGKGIATSLGALLIYDYRLTAAFALLFVVAWCAVRKMVLPGLMAFGCLPLVGIYLGSEPAKAVGISILAGVILIAHRKNLIEELSRLIPHRTLHPEHDQTEL
jgi:acyl phosphate:glycerol-3-phosphate acyltransferase